MAAKNSASGFRLSFFGAAEEVGRSSILLEFAGTSVLLDAGIKVGREKNEFPEIPLELPAKLSAIILSHAHLDHIGFVPALIKHGFKGKIYCTKPTRDLMHVLLADAFAISKERGQELYSAQDIEKTMRLVEVVPFEKSVKISRNFSFKLFSSGHIIGSAMILMNCAGKHLLYTGDFNTRESNLLEGCKVPKEKIDFLVTEATYGSRKDLLPSLKSVSKEFADAVNGTFLLGGKVLVPVFAVGRGQELMFVLENYIRSGYLPEDTVVFVDGMINSVNKICRHNVVFLRPEIPARILNSDDDPFKSPFFKIPASKSKSDVYKSENAVILATSGMLTGGPSVSYFKRLARNERNLIALVGFQGRDSLGRELLNGAKEVKIKESRVPVKAMVRKFGFSGHADFLGLFEFVRKIAPSKIFIVHGEHSKQLEFVAVVKNKLKKEAIVPKALEVFDL